MKTNHNIHELISTLIDNESTSPKEDAARIQDNPALEKQQQQYREIGRIIRTLDAPDPSGNFVEEVLARLPQKKHYNVLRLSFTLVTAAILLLAFSVGIYQLLPNKIPDSPNSDASLAAINMPTRMHLDVPESVLLSFQAEIIRDNGLWETLDRFEAIPEESLLITLANMTASEEAAYDSESKEMLTTMPLWDTWPMTTSPSFFDAFLLLETLNNAEVTAFNDLLRGSLATT
ncbi:MAG: hypothetical protein KAH38_05000 [Candidatus Hydrogenedentes bacterium]|nr:hypothetical protein [Candidatus Hydrogenedentota bacterium]